ncbi:MAG: hypothetical protein SGILL_008234 [Bacillariaceae sp.]
MKTQHSAFLLLLSSASALDTIKLKLFFGAQDLALWAGLDQGFFEGQNLDIQYEYVLTSNDVRESLAHGTVDLGFAAADNAVLTSLTLANTSILMGGDSSMNELMVQESIVDIRSLANKTFIVDYPGSAYALMGYDILKTEGGMNESEYIVTKIGSTQLRYEAMTGVNRSQYDASLLFPPFSILAKQQGLRSLGRAVDLIGNYQASALFATNEWLDIPQNQDKVTRFILAWVQSLRWALDPDNVNDVLGILQTQLNVTSEMARDTYDMMTTPDFGLTEDAALQWDGLENVLRIRNEFVGDAGSFDAQDFVDLTLYDVALKELNAMEYNTSSDGDDDDDDDSSGGKRVNTFGMSGVLAAGMVALLAFSEVVPVTILQPL